MCSMLLTVVVMARSEINMTRLAMSSGLIPEYDQITPATGNIDVRKHVGGRVRIDITPRMAIRIAMTMKV